MVASNSADQLINTLPTTNGGTGLATIGTAGQVLTVSAGGGSLQYSTPSSGVTAPVFYSTSGTAAANETSIATVTGLTITLPTAPANGTTNTVASNGLFGTTIGRGGSTDTITYQSSTGLTTAATSFSTGNLGSKTLVYNSGVWTQMAPINYNSLGGTIGIVSGGTGGSSQAAARGALGITPDTVWPSAHGVKAWTIDPAAVMTQASFSPVKGVAYATRIHNTTAATVSTIGFMTASVGSGVTNAYVSLYSTAGAVLGYGSLPSLVVNTYQTVTLTAVGSLALASDTDYFVVIQIGTSTTTSPGFWFAGDNGGGGSPNSTAALMNFNLTSTANQLTVRCANWGTTLNTTPAAVTGFTPTFNTLNLFATLN
jgi:hypothetical protein